jgi:hypothetical protein
MRSSSRSILTALLLVATAGTVACTKDEPPPPPAPAPPKPTAAASNVPAKATAAASAHAVKGNAEGASGEGSSGNTAAGEVVIKSHELPAPTKPIAEFKPASSGFKFQNYGNVEGVTNLTVTEVRRMFGDQVCGALEGDKCTLTPAAEQWMESSNKSMGGGHCEGFAALALLMERGQIDPKLFGAAAVPELEIKGNDKLQREIAYWFVTQGVLPMARAEIKTMTPVEVVAKLEESLKGGPETWTLGIYAPG